MLFKRFEDLIFGLKLPLPARMIVANAAFAPSR